VNIMLVSVSYALCSTPLKPCSEGTILLFFLLTAVSINLKI
jgi:hypothetical protein